LSIKFTTVPGKTLSQSILSTDSTFIPSDILGWDAAALTASDFGTQAFGAFLSADRTLLELFEWDPSTVASSSITILYRGLNFDGTQTTEVAANKRDWSSGTTTIQLGSDIPQLLALLVDTVSAQTIAGVKTFSSTPVSTAGNPTAGNELATKDYVDATATGTTNFDRVVIAGNAGETVAAGELVYLKESDGEFYLCDANTAATVNNIVLGFAQGAGTDGAAITGGILTYGLDSNQTGLTDNTIYYASDTAGAIASSAGTVEVTVGISRSTTSIFFDPRYNQQLTEDEQDALAGTSGTPSSSNKYVTDADTTGTGSVVRSSVTDALNIESFGNGADGAATIASGTTTLTRDMYYTDLTVETGGILKPNGFRIFVNGTLDCEGTGKIVSDGNNGGVGGNGSSSGSTAGGSAATVAYSTGSLPIPLAGEAGGAGGSASDSPSPGVNGDAGVNQAKSLDGNDAVAGGDGGDHTDVGGDGGAAGTETGTAFSSPNAYIPAYNLYDLTGSTITQFGVAPSGGGGAGGGSGDTNDGSGGGGGGSASSGGMVWISVKTITTLNVDALGGTGGQGGNGYTASKGGVGGGGAGGNGGVIILIYKSATTINSDVSGGTGGAVGSSGVATNSSAGTNGNSGTVYTITIT
tara:strand:- start:465 stop:2378 length:1914 start_codon:yes stop_codon:yes gene_type:complete